MKDTIIKVLKALLKTFGIFGFIVLCIIVILLSIFIIMTHKTYEKEISSININEKVKLVAKYIGFLDSKNTFSVSIFDSEGDLSSEYILKDSGCYSIYFKIKSDSLFIVNDNNSIFTNRRIKTSTFKIKFINDSELFNNSEDLRKQGYSEFPRLIQKKF